MKNSIGTVAAVLMAGAALAQTPETPMPAGIKEGKWSLSVVTDMQGMPKMPGNMLMENDMDYAGGVAHITMHVNGMNLPPQTVNNPALVGPAHIHMVGNGEHMTLTGDQCLTNKNPVPQAQAPTAAGCTPMDVVRSGNDVRYHMACKSAKSTTEMDGTASYQDDQMSGTAVMRQTMGDKQITSTSQISGKYLGPCQ